MQSLARLKKLAANSKTLNSIYDQLTGAEAINWGRVVLTEQCRNLITSLNVSQLSALEISGSFWGTLGFASYKTLFYPEFDICAATLLEPFDLIIAEQVFEHLLWPYRAGRNVYQMLKPG